MNKILAGAACLLLVFISCNMTGPDLDPVPDGKAAVRVSIAAANAESRTVWPSNAELMDVAKWELYAGPLNGSKSKVEQEVSTGGSTIYLEPGTYDFTVKGYNGDEDLILEGIIAGKAITLAGPNTLAFTVAPVLSGTGRVSLSIELPAGHNIATAKVYVDGSEISPAPAVSGNTVAFTETRAAGTYFYSVQLFNAEGELYGVAPELVQVRGNLTSAKAFVLSLANLNRKYGITYHLESGSFSSGVENPGHYRSTDAAFTLPEPARIGYAFNGWYTEAAFENAVTQIAQGSMEDKEYWAKWEPIIYTVAYNANGGSGSMAPVSHTYDEAKTLSANSFVRTGYTFAGWNARADGEGTDYAGGASAGNLSSIHDAIVTLYARWEPITYTVAYNANADDASGSMPLVSHTYDEAKNLSPNEFTRTGYALAGWNTQADGEGTGYAGGASVSNLSSTQGATVTLYAQWLPALPVNITLWVNEDGNILASNDDITISKNGLGGNQRHFTATVNGAYSDVQWYLHGYSVFGSRGKAQSIVINAADYANGRYYLELSVTKDNVPYSTVIRFTVIN
jgi:uncharacterized repeat protein (TIGR02543 family)